MGLVPSWSVEDGARSLHHSRAGLLLLAPAYEHMHQRTGRQEQVGPVGHAARARPGARTEASLSLGHGVSRDEYREPAMKRADMPLACGCAASPAGLNLHAAVFALLLACPWEAPRAPLFVGMADAPLIIVIRNRGSKSVGQLVKDRVIRSRISKAASGQVRQPALHRCRFLHLAAQW